MKGKMPFKMQKNKKEFQKKNIKKYVCLPYLKFSEPVTRNTLICLFGLNMDTPCFENSVDPNQLASKKPADQDPHCFQICL